MTTQDPFNLKRFLVAQENDYADALREIKQGYKQSHWIWFIFPQMRGLGRSSMAEYYGISSIEEARAYLDHPTLKARLFEISTALLKHKGKSTAYEILGTIDTIKVRSSMTLFDHILPNTIFAALLHDICKANIYVKITKYRKDQNNAWETYDTYGVDYSEFPVGHGEKSVIRLLQLGLHLTDDEILAIRWHMTAWELPFQSGEAKAYLNAAKNKCPLLTIIQTADGLASAILETK